MEENKVAQMDGELYLELVGLRGDCSRLASRVEELEKALQDALNRAREK